MTTADCPNESELIAFSLGDLSESRLDAIREGFEVHVIVSGTRPVNVNPDDGRRALQDIQNAGAILEE